MNILVSIPQFLDTYFIATPFVSAKWFVLSGIDASIVRMERKTS